MFAGGVFEGFSEADISFAPTFKFKKSSLIYDEKVFFINITSFLKKSELHFFDEFVEGARVVR